MKEKFQCSKCKEYFYFNEIDQHHPDKKNKPKITIPLCKDCHYEEHKSSSKKYKGENILSDGYGIMPNKILFDNELSSTAKILYVLISSLCASSGFCFANNKYLSKKMGISTTMISVNITKLEKYLKFENRTSYNRKIYLSDEAKTNHKENLKQPLNKFNSNIKENLIHNNIKEYYKDNINNSKQSLPVNEILNEFYEFNPTLNFGNKTQRTATEELLKKYGLEQLKVMIKQYRVIMNNKFCPVATTPIAFKNKLGDIIAFINKEKSNSRFIDLDE